MKTLSLVLSTLWTVARKTPILLSLLLATARCTPAILQHLPAALVLIGKIRDAFGSEAVQEALKALQALIDKLSPPTPQVDRVDPTNPKQEKRRRLFRFRNRLEVAGILTDTEAQELCALHNTGSNTNSPGTADSGNAGFQYA